MKDICERKEIGLKDKLVFGGVYLVVGIYVFISLSRFIVTYINF